jgi:Domain of unknown function (DUF3850)
MSAEAMLFTGRITHRVKSWPENFSSVVAGRKTFEVRRDDRSPPYQCGDLVMLQEWVPPETVDGLERTAAGFTRRQALYLIGYVTRGPCMPEGWCAFEVISTETALRVAAAILKQHT